MKKPYTVRGFTVSGPDFTIRWYDLVKSSDPIEKVSKLLNDAYEAGYLAGHDQGYIEGKS